MTDCSPVIVASWPARLAALVFVLLVCMLIAPAASAQDPSPHIEQFDLDADGRPDITQIMASFRTVRDSIWVYDGAANMPLGDDWRVVADFQDDTWIFDVGDNGDAQLIVRFARVVKTIEARLYDDQDGDGKVAFSVEGGNVIVTETPHPALVVVVDGEWRLPDGHLNWNLRFSSDGPTVEQVHTYNLTNPWRRFLRFDGQPDAELEFHDRDLDGVPEYGLYRLLALTPRDWGGGIGRTWIWANEGHVLPANLSSFLFWPYLAGGPVMYSDPAERDSQDIALVQVSRYFDSAPGIVVDWDAAKVSRLSFPGYPIEQGFHVNTHPVFEKEAVNYASFENFQAYYDLAADRDGSPELHIRQLYFDANDVPGGDLPSPLNSIRWSWNQSNRPDLSWDYKLGMAGRYQMTTTVEFPDFSYLSVPFGEIPSWIRETDWDIATFVARENAVYQSSEGIYAWDIAESKVDGDPSTLSRYLAGLLNTHVERAFSEIDAGWRGEVAPHLNGRSYLYLSPIDRRLHLRGATQGLLTIDDKRKVVYKDADHDGYLDQWRTIEGGEIGQQLVQLPGCLIYGGHEEVRIELLAGVLPSMLDLLPPTTHDEWLQLGTELEGLGPVLALDQLGAMFDQFDGLVMAVEGASVRDLRPVDERGGRFVLDLEPGFRVSGSPILDLAALKPGEYLVRYVDDAFYIAPLMPPALSLAIVLPKVAQEGSSAGAMLLQVTIHNTGTDDALGLTLIAAATAVEGATTELTREPVDALAGEAAQVLISIPSTATGSVLHVHIEDADGQVLTTAAPMSLAIPSRTARDTISSVAQRPILLPLMGLFAVLLAVGVDMAASRHEDAA